MDKRRRSHLGRLRQSRTTCLETLSGSGCRARAAVAQNMPLAWDRLTLPSFPSTLVVQTHHRRLRHQIAYRGDLILSVPEGLARCRQGQRRTRLLAACAATPVRWPATLHPCPHRGHRHGFGGHAADACAALRLNEHVLRAKVDLARSPGSRGPTGPPPGSNPALRLRSECSGALYRQPPIPNGFAEIDGRHLVSQNRKRNP